MTRVINHAILNSVGLSQINTSESLKNTKEINR